MSTLNQFQTHERWVNIFRNTTPNFIATCIEAMTLALEDDEATIDVPTSYEGCYKIADINFGASLSNDMNGEDFEDAVCFASEYFEDLIELNRIANAYGGDLGNLLNDPADTVKRAVALVQMTALCEYATRRMARGIHYIHDEFSDTSVLIDGMLEMVFGKEGK